MMLKFVVFCSLFIISVLSAPSNEKIDDFEDWNLDEALEEPKDVDNITFNKPIMALAEPISHIQKIPRRGEQMPQAQKERDRRDTRKNNKKGNKKQQADELSSEKEHKDLDEHSKKDSEMDAVQETGNQEIKPTRKPSRKNKQGRGKKPKLNAEGEESRKQRKGNKKQRKPKQPKNRRNKQKTTTTETIPVEELTQN